MVVGNAHPTAPATKALGGQECPPTADKNVCPTKLAWAGHYYKTPPSGFAGRGFFFAFTQTPSFFIRSASASVENVADLHRSIMGCSYSSTWRQASRMCATASLGMTQAP